MEQLGEDFKRARMEQRQKSSAYQRLKQKLTQVQDELKGLMEVCTQRLLASAVRILCPGAVLAVLCKLL